MKSQLSKFLFALLLVLSTTTIRAATNYWDIDDANPGAGGAAPAGTWDTGTTANWTTDSTGASAATTWAANDTAFFSAGSDAIDSYTVTIGSGLTNMAAGVYVEEGYVLLGPGYLSLGTGNGVVHVATNSVLNINGAGTGFLTGSGGITKRGSGVLALGGTMPYTRSSLAIMTINEGVVEISSDLALGVVPAAARTNAVLIDGGTLRHIGAASVTLNVARGVTIGPAGGTIEVTNTSTIGLSLPSAATFTINGGSSAVLTKTGAGRFTMNTTANTYTGKYVILGGSLNIPGDGRLGNVPSSFQADNITLNGSSATLRIAVTTGVTLNANRGITLGASGGELAQPGPGTLTYNGIISGTAGGALRIDANDTFGGGSALGIVVLGGANTYNGNTTIASSMTLRCGAAGVIPDASTVTISGAAGVFDLNGFDETIGSLSSSVASTVTIGARTLTLSNGRSTFAGNITGTGAFVKSGTSGTPQTMSGNNTYTGATTVNGGTLAFSGDSSACTGATTVNGGKLRIAAASAFPNSPIYLNGVNTVLDVADIDVTIAALGGSGVVVSNAFHTLTVSGNASAGQAFHQYSGYSGVLTNGGLLKAGTHTMALRGSNTFDGALTLNAGTLSVGAGPDRIPATTILSIPSGATFQLDASHQTLASLSSSGGNLNLGGGTLTVNEAGFNTFSGVIQDAELPVVPSLGHGLRGYYYTNIDMTGLAAVRDDATVNLANMAALPGYAPGAKTNQISVRWLGQVLTTAAGTYKFTVTCDDGQRLWVNGALLVEDWVPHGATAKSGSITLAANTKYDIIMEMFNNTAGGSARLSWTPPGDTTTNVIPSEFLFLPGPGALVMNGPGTLTLANANPYSGQTTVAAGTLNVTTDGGLGSGNVAVANNATLSLEASVVSAAMSPNASLLLSGSNPKVNLNYTGTETIRGLSFDGGTTYQPAGTYGTAASGATFQDDVRFGGLGLLNVAGAPTTNALTVSAGTAVYGSSINLTSTVSPSGATGSVTFFDGANWLGSVALNGSGIAVLSVNTLQVTASPHSIMAVYGGDATHSPSTSAAANVSTTPATVTATIVIANRAYDGTTNASISSATVLNGVLSSDTNYVRLSSGVTAYFDDKNVGTNKNVTINGLGIEGSLSSNYSMAGGSTTGTANITEKALTVTGLTATNKVYDATTAAVFGGTPVLNGVISPDVVTLGGTPVATFATKNIGTNKVVTVSGYALSGADALNYVVTPPALTANVSIAPASVTGVTANNKVYNGTTAATLSGTATLSGVISPDVVNLGGTAVATFTNKNSGLRGVTVTGYTISGLDATNYTLAQPTGLAATITAVPTTTVLLSSFNPSKVTSNVTFTATVTSSPLTTDFPAGSISFLTNGVTVSIITLVSNAPGVATAVYNTAALPVGTHTIAAQYPGDLVNFNYQSSGDSLSQVVQSLASVSAVTISNIAGTTLSYGGGQGSRFVLLATNDLSAPTATWLRLATNLTTPGTFTIPAVGTQPRIFYRVESE